jgi:hypothetical protein
MELAPSADDRADAGPGTVCLPDSFFQHVLAHNPFTLNRASADGGEGPDVVQIHSEVFVRLTELAGEAVRLRRGLGVLLAGEAGAGKSHVFGRLARWAAVGSRACFVVVRGLQTDPELLPAAIVRSAGAALAGRTGAAPGRTPLYRLTHAAVRVALADNQERYSWDRIGRGFARLADRLAPGARRVPEGRATFDLLYRFFRSATRATDGKEDGATAEMILRWFTGGMLDATEARRLHLPPSRHRDDPVALTDPEWARQGLTALAVLATAVGKPLILAIDQAEELDSGRFAALSRFLNGLLNHAPGVLAVTAADTAAILRWRDRGDVPNSAWNRMGQFTLEPARLRPADGINLVRRRLDDALAPFKEVEFLYRLRADAALFPLHLKLNACGVWAGEALEAARHAWDREQEVIRQVGGAEWLAGWAERMAPLADPGTVTEEDAESSLTREQVQAAISVRFKSTASPTEVEQSDEVAVSESMGVTDGLASVPRQLADIASSTTQQEFHTAIADHALQNGQGLSSQSHEIHANGEPSLTNDEFQSAVAWSGQSTADIDLDSEACSAIAPSTEATEPQTEADAPPQVDPLPEAPETVAPDVVAEEIRQVGATPRQPSTLLQEEGHGVATGDSASPALPGAPDPVAIRPRLEPEPPIAAPAADSTATFAPTGRRTVLTPVAWPPSAPPPTPREELIDQAVAAFVADYLATRGPRSELPADAEQIAELILNLLQQCVAADRGYGVLQAERVPSWKATPTACDLVVRQQADGNATLRTGVLVLTGSRATAIAGYLRRLTTEAQPFDRLFLITEERVGLPLGPRGLEYLQELQQRSSVQLHTLELTASEHTELSALRAAVRQARGGTLATDGARISEAEAIASHHRRQRYLASHFLSAILFDAPPTELLRQVSAITQS